MQDSLGMYNFKEVAIIEFPSQRMYIVHNVNWC